MERAEDSIELDVEVDDSGNVVFPFEVVRRLGAKGGSKLHVRITARKLSADLAQRMVTEEEIQAAEDSLSALKILGLNGKSARSVGRVVRRGKKSETGRYDLLIAGVCVESKLPILTGRPGRYRTVKSLRVVPARRLRGYESTAAVESRSR